MLNLLSAYPDGLSLHVLAARFDVGVDTMRQNLITYLDLESWGWIYDIFRRPALEFVQAESGYSTEGSGSAIVRIVAGNPAGLGAEHLSVGDLALIYTAGAALLGSIRATRTWPGPCR